MTTYTSRLIRINLSDGDVKAETIPEEIVGGFIGGRGLAVNYLYRELAPGIDPLGAENKLFLATGVLAGTNAQSVSRWMVCTKSPLTGGFARSVAGADFGAWLKFAGYDLIIIEGKSEKPVYVHLTRDSCQISDASELWGKDTKETQEWLHQRYGKNTRVACIGPAGERLVKYAAIVSARRTASRCGAGTVMGSKNLKAIAITAQRNLQLHDPEGFKQLVRKQVDCYQASKGFHRFKDVGTTHTQDVTNSLGVYPVKNFRYGQQTDFEKITCEEYRKLRTGNFGCYSCSVRCGKMHLVPTGPYAGANSEGPEYESIWSFTAPIDSTDIGATVAADQLCDDLGLDTISAGNCIGFAYELYERGILTRKDTDGLELTYGNHSAMIALIKKIASREGLGDILADGCMRAAVTIGNGAEAYAMHVKGLELSGYESRGAKSQGFNYATANIGASHCYGFADQEIFGAATPRKVDRFAEEENADIVIYNQDSCAMSEVGIVCSFACDWGWFPQIFCQMMAAVTGIEQFADSEYLRIVARRIYTLERAFNVREGLSRKDDTLPHRMLSEPLHTRGAPGEGQMVRAMDKFLDRYYQARGWTQEGIPSLQTLNELDLGYVVKDIT